MMINKNTGFKGYNVSSRLGAIQYIVLHYTGAEGTAKNNIDYFNGGDRQSSADFFVGHEGEIYQYNPDLKKYYSWHCGGGKQSTSGGSCYGMCTNANSIGIEMCTHNTSSGWILYDATINSAIELVKYLIATYNIPASHVIRHYAVNGKYCPGVKGWIAPLGSETKWNNFKSKLAVSMTSEPENSSVPFFVRVAIDDLNIRKGPGTNYDKTGKYTKKGTFTIVEVQEGEGSTTGWGLLKSCKETRDGWISLDFAQKVV